MNISAVYDTEYTSTSLTKQNLPAASKFLVMMSVCVVGLQICSSKVN